MPESIDEIGFDEVKLRVCRAIEGFASEAQFLLMHGLQERSVASTFARYLKQEFPDWDVDVEYNRIIDGTSREARSKVAAMMMRRDRSGFVHLQEPELVRVIPDIIIHRRGTRANLLAIEVKLSSDQQEIAFDMEKLNAYCQYGELQYRFALFVRFQSDPNGRDVLAPDGMKWFRRE